MGGGLEAGVAGAVDGRAGYGEFLAVVGLDTGAVIALGNVNGGVVRAVGGVDLDARLGVGRLMRSAVLFAETAELFTGAGTAVWLLLTSDADLFFSEATLSNGRKLCLGLERRVLTLLSGGLGELDLKLLVRMGLCSGLGLPV